MYSVKTLKNHIGVAVTVSVYKDCQRVALARRDRLPICLRKFLLSDAQ
ncbi:hypothetical protein Z946_409 [Sulfitobacter noctilucicola]|nr:hypothetical protein Z946_409 [Sulfitobacter noctilucicola]